MMELSRREALKWALVGGGSLLFPWTMGKPALAQFSPQIPRFELPFKIPPVLSPVRSDRDTDYYEITLEKANLEILPGLTTEIWGYNGITPGPTIRQRGGTRSSGGKESVVRFINKLGMDGQGREIRTTTHLHGMASLPQYDGYAEDYIPDNFFKDYFYPNDRAATIWYHDHALDLTARNVYMGLAGMYIVEDQYELDLPLPKGEFLLEDKNLYNPRHTCT